MRRTTPPTYTPPPPPGDYQAQQPPAQAYACSWCFQPWTDDHAALCTHRPLSQAQVSAACEQAYLRGAREAMQRAALSVQSQDDRTLLLLLADEYE